jgi:O-antigen/teichoic acid export membrane protein
VANCFVVAVVSSGGPWAALVIAMPAVRRKERSMIRRTHLGSWKVHASKNRQRIRKSPQGMSKIPSFVFMDNTDCGILLQVHTPYRQTRSDMDKPLPPVVGGNSMVSRLMRCQGPGWCRRLICLLSASRLARRALSGTALSLVGALAGKSLGLIASVFAARLLGKEGFGQFGLIQSTMETFSVFAGLGLGLTATKFVAELRNAAPARAARIVALSRYFALLTGSATAALVFAFADRLAAGVLASPSMATGLRIVSIVLLLGALNGAQRGALYGFEAFGAIAKIAIISGVVGLFVMVAAASAAGLTGAVWALAINMAFACVLSHHFLKRETKKHAMDAGAAGAWTEWRVLANFSLPAVLGGLSVLPVYWACNLIVVNQPNGYAEMGLLNAANQLRNIILFIPSVITSVILPMLANLANAGEHQKQGKLLAASVAVSAAVALCGALGVCVLWKPILSIFGPGFESGRTVLILQVFGAAIAASIGVLAQFLISAGAMWWLIALQLVWACAYLGLTWAFRSEGGAGVSLAYLLAYLVHFATMSTLTWCKLGRLVRQQAGSSNQT